ncbi:DNA polymerase alpha catalytic subunit [Hypsizygus marmoreus]|uniref:DNA polymerase n=1 Tax=Hypsizygus marmoreus TaxID=39966 RepID=A0A369J4D5_HYPMA|nr:DNA polymerase alpha catalytic subunit [Hypsizygus marmoreus]
MADRSRRDRKPLDKLAEYRRAREGGKRVLKEEDVEIYDEVSEDQYKSIVRGRLQKDDFVVDDGVEGYMDNGMDDWTGGHDQDEESEEDVDRKKKSKQKGKTQEKRTKPKPPPAAMPSISAYRPVVSEEQEEDFMSSVLGTMDMLPASTSAIASKVSRKRKPSPDYDYSDSSSPIRYDASAYRRRPSFGDTSSDGPIDDGILGPSSDDLYMSPKKKVRVAPSGDMTPATTRLSQLEVTSDYDSAADTSFDDLDMDAFMEVDEELEVKPPVKVESKDAKLPKPKAASELDSKPSWLSVYDSLAVAEPDTLGPLTSTIASSASSSNISALEPDSSLRFFWLDYLEHEGKLYFVGKLKDKTSGTWVSCCITVEGIQRNLFVLPREKRVEPDDEGNMCETDIVPTPQDVHGDFEMIRKQIGVKSWKGKFVKRKYAFGEQDVPRGESQWLKVVYGFNDPQIPMNACSPNIAQIFGTNTTAFELLVLKRKIMGPCWLEIKHPQIDNKGVSWCKVEATVTDPKDINPFPETDSSAPRDMPPLTIVSLSVRTIVNHQENKREIVCATARIWHDILIDNATPPEKLPCTVHTFVRPLDRFPPNFETQARANGKGFISPMKNERMLLSSLLMTLHKADPDVIVGHDFLGVSLDVLLHRMRDLKVDHWSRIGRFRRARWPNIGKQGSNLKFLNGRMLCDLASDGAKSMIPSTTWSMTEMCRTHLRSERQDIDPDDTASYLDGSLSTPDRLLTFVRHCELDAHYQMAIAAKVQILPLTRQLTNLAGNSWNKTLNGGRAERNEYILLHEFHRLKYICPDKLWGKKSAAAVKQEAQDDDPENAKTTKGKRDKYKGGLVFEPKRGLWDRFILVMDFNSLYPSIIQEYNIDFTTVEKVDDDEDGEERIPEPPSSDVPQGVLPRLIATLVNRRRQVKSLMKDKTATQAQLLQYDIKQQALKLTANSMYGCLGFEYSRFYARPLAALTTYKGREILTHTRELAESLELDVVYGDTDSVFVNSNVTELSEALRISAEFKKAVNDRYKLLEIDLDGVFQRLLLLQKKKYAAIKVEDGMRTSTEIKGLDMKRREYCALSKNVSQYVLDQILSGEATENVVENIHEYLRTVSENVREGKTKIDDFIIFKRLGKAPEDYPDAKSQPHVQVALRLKAKGGTPRSGDVIPYLFCLGEGEEPAKTTQADRAKHPDEVRRAGSGLKIDYEYYLAHQVLPPIERLCEPIEGTDRARLAECLGLDPARYRNSTGGAEERSFAALDSQMSDAERFKDSVPFIVRCRQCKGELPFAPLHDRDASIFSHTGPTCPSCSITMSTGSLMIQLECQIRDYIGKYYEGWVECNDPTCGYRTRMMGVYGRRCLRPGCRGTVSFEYSDAQLYNQLRYFSYLFNGDRAIKASKGGTEHDALVAIVQYNAGCLQALTDCVEKYLDQCGRRWVDLSGLFSFMKV